jgi:hypothetical protein
MPEKAGLAGITADVGTVASANTGVSAGVVARIAGGLIACVAARSCSAFFKAS